MKPNQFVDPPKVTSKTKLVAFPKNLSVDDLEPFKQVHQLLEKVWASSFGLKFTDTFAQQHTLEKQRIHTLRFLWLFGAYGTLDSNNSRLVVDPKTFLANRGSEKQLAIWSFLEGVVFKILSEFGVRCKRFALDGVKFEDLTTGTGYVRNKGWTMHMSFENKIGGLDSVKALQIYCEKLDEKFGKNGFSRFYVADMAIF